VKTTTKTKRKPRYTRSKLTKEGKRSLAIALRTEGPRCLPTPEAKKEFLAIQNKALALYESLQTKVDAETARRDKVGEANAGASYPGDVDCNYVWDLGRIGLGGEVMWQKRDAFVAKPNPQTYRAFVEEVYHFVYGWEREAKRTEAA